MADGDERLGAWTQTALLTLLCYDEVHGLELSGYITADHFDGHHKDLAEAVLAYRRKYKGKPPGKKHMPMLVERLPVQEDHSSLAGDGRCGTDETQSQRPAFSLAGRDENDSSSFQSTWA